MLTTARNSELVRDAASDAVPVAYLAIGGDGRLVIANLQARAMFGLREPDIGRPFKDLEVSLRPVELRSRIEQVLTVSRGLSLREVEWQKGAERRFVDVHISRLVAATGETVGVGVAYVDVTRYRRLQEELQELRSNSEAAYEELESTNDELETMNKELETMCDELNMRTDDLNQTNAFLDAVLGSLDAGVAVVGGELEVQAWSRGAHELWGLTPDEVVGRHFLSLGIGLPLDRLRNPIRRALADGDGKPWHIRLEAVNRRGRPIECAVTLTALQGSIGDRHRVIVMMQTVDSLGS